MAGPPRQEGEVKRWVGHPRLCLYRLSNITRHNTRQWSVSLFKDTFSWISEYVSISCNGAAALAGNNMSIIGSAHIHTQPHTGAVTLAQYSM